MAEEYLDMFLRKPSPPTAIICFEDHMATQLLLHAERRGLRVPGDLSILGCSNNNLCSYLTPALTSIEQYPEEMGRPAYELIQRRQQEGEEPGKRKPETILHPAAISDPRVVWTAGIPREHTHALIPRHTAGTAGSLQHTPQVTPKIIPRWHDCSPSALGEQSKRELMAQLGLRDGKHFSTAYLNPALDAGYLERTIPAQTAQQTAALPVDGERASVGKE